MKGLELSRAYFEEYGLPMLKEQFPALLPYVCAGLTGSGSECFGFDDTLSADHDFEPSFCLFLPGEDVVSRRDAFLLERAYDKLPREFMGFRRGLMGPVGGSRRGVIRLGDFLEARTGTRDGSLTLGQWLTVPEHFLAEVVNGALFREGDGEFAALRARLRYSPMTCAAKSWQGTCCWQSRRDSTTFHDAWPITSPPRPSWP